MSTVDNRKVAYTCQYYLGDRPCIWHKQSGVLCECEHYTPLKESLLIIKLDAVGDVLRTTCLLPGINNKWPDARITWVTREEAKPLLENNPYLTEVVSYGPDAVVHLVSRSFDRVINLDSGKISSGLAAMVKAKEKIGYVLHEDGYVTATNTSAEKWLRLGVFDDLKKANEQTYQDIMCSIVDLTTDGMKYVLELTEEEKHNGKEYLQSLGIDFNKPVVGIHTGGGGRWTRKQWGEESFVSLIATLRKEVNSNIQVLLFGGPLEGDQNKRIVEKLGDSVFDSGCENSLRHFAALVNHCSVMLSGDTLAMHMALAMGKRVVVLFGPTSSAEIELFGMGEKIVPEMDCLVCYLYTCDVDPYCMERISVDMVKQAVARQLDLLASQQVRSPSL